MTVIIFWIEEIIGVRRFSFSRATLESVSIKEIESKSKGIYM